MRWASSLEYAHFPCRLSYWIIRDLLYSGMVSTARGIILNISDLIRRFGFIQSTDRASLVCTSSVVFVHSQVTTDRRVHSGLLAVSDATRSYYLTRSQPPVFSMMLSVYHAFTGYLEVSVMICTRESMRHHAESRSFDHLRTMRS